MPVIAAVPCRSLVELRIRLLPLRHAGNDAHIDKRGVVKAVLHHEFELVLRRQRGQPLVDGNRRKFGTMYKIRLVCLPVLPSVLAGAAAGASLCCGCGASGISRAVGASSWPWAEPTHRKSKQTPAMAHKWVRIAVPEIILPLDSSGAAEGAFTCFFIHLSFQKLTQRFQTGFDCRQRYGIAKAEMSFSLSAKYRAGH